MKMMVGEWKRILSKKMSVIILLAVACVPLLYSGIFLSSYWDPYGKTNQIPVAVVNSDAGANMGGKHLAIGQQFVADLQRNASFKWTFDKNKQQALDELEQGHYFLVIELPANFSTSATTLLDPNPQKMQLNYYTNPGRSYPGAQIASSAMLKIERQIADAVRKQYAQTIFDNLKALADGMGQASDGSKRVDEGVKQLATGSQTLNENMNKLASGLLTFNNGLQGVGDGTSKLRVGLSMSSDGALKLVDGSTTAASGAASVYRGAVDLKTGVAQLSTSGTQLSGAASQTSGGVVSLRDSLQQSVQGTQQLQTDMTAYSQGLTEANTALKEIAAAQSGNAALQTQLNEIVAKLAQLERDGSQLQGTVTRLAGDSDKHARDAETLATGTQVFATKVQAFSDKVAVAHTGSERLVVGAGALQAGTAKVAVGSQNLSAGLAELKQGSMDLANGVGKLSAAATVLKDGSQRLAAGSESLQQGTRSLANGTGSLNSALQQGADKSRDAGSAADATYDMFASPTQLAGFKAHDVAQYGAGLTPYILSIGLFAGALMLSSAYALSEPSIEPTSGWDWFLSKLSVTLPVGVLSSLLADFVLITGLGLEVQSMWRFVLFTIIVATTFMTLFILLATSIGKVGQFLGFVLMLLQVGGSEGTFPKILTPAFFQTVNPLLPMTYAIRGFREVISIGTDYGDLWKQAGILGGYAVVFALCTIVVLNRRVANQKRSLGTIDNA